MGSRKSSAKSKTTTVAIKKIEQHLRKEAKQRIDQRKRLAVLRQAAHRPLIDAYAALYGAHNASVRKYTNELVKEVKRQASDERLLRPRGGDVPPGPKPSGRDASELVIPPVVITRFPPYSSVQLPVPAVTGGATYWYPSGRPSADGSLLGGSLSIENGKAGTAHLWQGAAITFHSDDAGWTGVNLAFRPLGYITMISPFGFAVCDCALQLSVFEAGSLAPESTDKLDYGPPHPIPGTISVQTFRTDPTNEVKILDCGFDRRKNVDYVAYASLICFLSFEPFNDSKADLAVCEQSVFLDYFRVTLFK